MHNWIKRMSISRRLLELAVVMEEASRVQHLKLMRKLDKIERKVERSFNLEKQMATKAEFDAAVAAVAEGIADLGTDVQAVLAKLEELRNQTGGISAADLDASIATLTNIATNIKSIDTGLEAAVAAAPPAPPTA